MNGDPVDAEAASSGIPLKPSGSTDFSVRGRIVAVVWIASLAFFLLPRLPVFAPPSAKDAEKVFSREYPKLLVMPGSREVLPRISQQRQFAFRYFGRKETSGDAIVTFSRERVLWVVWRWRGECRVSPSPPITPNVPRRQPLDNTGLASKSNDVLSNRTNSGFVRESKDTLSTRTNSGMFDAQQRKMDELSRELRGHEKPKVDPLAPLP